MIHCGAKEAIKAKEAFPVAENENFEKYIDQTEQNRLYVQKTGRTKFL